MDRQDVKSVGDITLEGGFYGKISCAGDLLLKGEVEAYSIKAAGDLEAIENVKVETLRVYGDAEFRKDVEAIEAKIYGDAEIFGHFQCQDLKVFGECTLKKLDAEKLTVFGALERAEEVNAEKAEFSGEVQITGVLNVGHGEFRLVGDSKVGEIYCESLSVESDGEFFNGVLSGLISRGKSGTLTSDLIEGDDIYLENTTAKMVRGNKIKIGPGCRIQRVEYNEKLEVHSSAEVKEKVEL